MTKAPGMTRANVNPKNGVTCIISDTTPARPSLGAPIFFGLATAGNGDRWGDPCRDRSARKSKSIRPAPKSCSPGGVGLACEMVNEVCGGTIAVPREWVRELLAGVIDPIDAMNW
jgi:hypothetical protein